MRAQELQAVHRRVTGQAKHNLVRTGTSSKGHSKTGPSKEAHLFNHKGMVIKNLFLNADPFNPVLREATRIGLRPSNRGRLNRTNSGSNSRDHNKARKTGPSKRGRNKTELRDNKGPLQTIETFLRLQIMYKLKGHRSGGLFIAHNNAKDLLFRLLYIPPDGARVYNPQYN